MIRDTFEANPGLCELFKRKILDRAQSTGLNKDIIDFESRIDMKGTFQDNLRTFYREYPQLAQDSDYFRLKSPRPLSGVALEQSWLSYERSNGRTDHYEETRLTVPQLTITYTVGRASRSVKEEKETELQTISTNTMLPKPEMNQNQSIHSELVGLLIDRVTRIAGENVTQTILHQIGREIGSTAFHHSGNQAPAGNLAGALDRTLRDLALGRVIGFEEVDHPSSITYVSTIEECSLCRNRVAGTSTCNVIRGMLTRWFESHVQKKAESAEADCIDGHPHLCVFRVMFRK